MNKRQSQPRRTPRTRKVGLAKPPSLVKVKKGQLLMAYGRDDDGNVDVCFANGEGCSKNDASLLWSVVGTERCYPNIFNPLSFLDHFKYEKSLLKELEDRGYDITTIHFSIQKKVVEE